MKVFSDYFSEERIETRMIKKENRRALRKEKKLKKARVRKNEINRIKKEYADAPALIRFIHVNSSKILHIFVCIVILMGVFAFSKGFIHSEKGAEIVIGFLS